MLDDIVELRARLRATLPRCKVELVVDDPLFADHLKVGGDIRVYPTLAERLDAGWLTRARAFKVTHARGFEATVLGLDAVVELVRSMT